jgi:hypothetical protein
MGFGFQDLDSQIDETWVSRPARQTDRQDLGFRTSTDRQTRFGFQDLLDKQTDEI